MWALGVAAGLVVGWSCGSGAFACSDDAQCGADGGVCAEGFCAFPEEGCSSGLRWGEHAGDRSGECVPASADTDPPGTSDDDGPLDGPPSTDDTTTTGLLDTTADGSSSDGPPDGDVEFRDDELAGEFEAGTMQGVIWAGDRLALADGVTDGTFTSRVFDGQAPAQWQTAQWLPDGPYGKPLPDDGAAERGYADGNVSMEGNVLLLHLDGEGLWSDGTDVLDASGAGSHGRLLSDGGPVQLVPGVFGTAIDDHAASRISIPTQDAPGLAFGTDDFTWSLWFRMSDPCGQNHVYMGVDNSDLGVDLHPHLWLGCTDDNWSACPGRGVRAGGVLRSEHATQDDGAFYCSQGPIDDDQWHHVVLVKEGHDGATLRLYLDGALEHTGDASFTAPMEYPDDPDFAIGAFSRGTYPAIGVFDEVAIWRRALSSNEVTAVHQRGASTLRVLVRSCLQADCADDPPFGPALVDPPDALGPGTELSLTGVPVGRWVQYRLVMSTTAGNGTKGPALRSVTIRGQRI